MLGHLVRELVDHLVLSAVDGLVDVEEQLGAHVAGRLRQHGDEVLRIEVSVVRGVDEDVGERGRRVCDVGARRDRRPERADPSVDGGHEVLRAQRVRSRLVGLVVDDHDGPRLGWLPGSTRGT